jgi:hypothetical protein
LNDQAKNLLASLNGTTAMLSVLVSEQRELSSSSSSSSLPRVLLPAATFVGQLQNFSRSLSQQHCPAPGDPPRMSGVGCAPTKLIDGSVLFDERLSLSWRIDCDKSLIAVTLNISLDITGWVGVGFGQNPNMVEVSSVRREKYNFYISVVTKTTG